MTNKQIIIDRVDVSEWTDEEVHYKFAKHSSKAIRQIAFDLYKQLERKEQECQQAMDNYVQLDLQRVKEYNELVDLYKAKEQECEKKSREIGNLGYKIKNQRKEINIRLQQLDQLKAENEKLKQTLTEIKEIADKDFRHTAWEEYAKQLKQILQKISECEGENE